MEDKNGPVGRIMLGQIALVFFAHVVGDFYAAFYGPLVPFLKERLGLTLTMTGGLGAVLAVGANFMQPAIGLWSERVGRRHFVTVGVLCAAVGMSFLGLAWNLPVAYIALLVGGLGVGLFHPCGAAIAGNAAGRVRSTAVAVYMTGGNLGVSLAPVVVPVVAAASVQWLPLLAVPGVLFAGLLWRSLREEDDCARPSGEGSLVKLAEVFRRLWPIFLHVMLRFIPMYAYFILLPLYGTLRGMTDIQAGRVLALFVLSGAIGSLAGGYLSDRLPRRPLSLVSNIGAGVCLLLAPSAQGMAFYGLLVIGSILFYLALPLQIVMAQERVPRAESLASGIVMGFAYGFSGLALVPLGRLGDHVASLTGSELIGVTRILQLAPLFLFAAAFVTLFLRSHPPTPDLAKPKD